MYRNILLTLICVLFITGMAQAKIQFVDASLNNTKIGGAAPELYDPGPPESGNYKSGNNSGTDGYWDLRTDVDYTNGGTLWQSDNAAVPSAFDAEITDELSITMTIPLVGIYDVYGLVWNDLDGSGLWDAAFKLDPNGSYTVYDRNNAEWTAAVADDFTGTVSVSGAGGFDMYKVYLGQITTTSDDEQVTIYAQGLDNGQVGDQRTWIDGIGYDTDLYVVVEPDQISALPGESAVYTATPSAPASSYQWYMGQSGDANNPLADETGHISGSDSNQLTIVAQASDTGYYWCKAVIDGNSLPSQTVLLDVGRMVAHWTLDVNDYNSVDDLYVDDSGEGHDADVSGTPTFVSGVEPGLSNEGVQLALANASGSATAGTWAPSEVRGQFTLSAWIKWDGTLPDIAGDILTKADGWGTTRWLLRLRDMSSVPKISFYNFDYVISCFSISTVPADEWMHVCATFDGPNSLAILYINGQEDVRDTSASADVGLGATIKLGYNYQDDTGFPGVLDDLRIYNYALSAADVNTLYTDFRPPPFPVEPEQIAVFPGEEAVYTAMIGGPNTTTYQWYMGQSGDANNPLADETGHISGSDSNQLTITAQAGDEGYYWCEAFIGGVDYDSETVSLGVKRMVSRWTLDVNDYNSVDDLYVDDTGEGRDANVSGTPEFVLGVEPGLSNEGVQLALADANGRATAGTWAPSELTGEFTLSGWIKWDGTFPDIAGDILTKADGWGTTRWLLRLRDVSDDPVISFYNHDYVISCLSDAIDANKWIHVCATFDDSNSLAILYINGLEEARDDTASADVGLDATIRLGYNYQDDTGFPGVLDDLRIYNYALSDVDVAILYTDFKPGESVCFKDQIPVGDITGPDAQPDCMVNFYDIAEIAKDWLVDTTLYY